LLRETSVSRDQNVIKSTEEKEKYINKRKNFGRKNKGREYFEDIGLDGIILKVTVKKDGEGIWNGLASLTQNRNKWWPIVNVLINVWFQKAKNAEGLTN
jgi:hypothetical protein